MTDQPERPDQAGDQTGNEGIDSRTAVQVPDDEIRDTEPALAPAQQASVATEPAAVESPSWIDQVAEFADQTDPDAGSNRLLVPQRFTVEVRVGGDPERVITTRVVHLETREEDAWPGWSGTRLLDFLQKWVNVIEPQHDWAAEPAHSGLGPRPDHVDAGSPQPALAVHRFGVLTAGRPVIRRGGMSARLRLDPSDLDLPAGHAAVAQADLYAEPVGAGSAEVLDTRRIDLAAVHTVDAVLRGRLPDRDPPFTVFAVVRILVEAPAGPPAAGLGTATLELAADEWS